ncbi:major facilitator superfamily domain-containing protein [Obelidium mucronatum]|nr:major facilitator superfamily domain-containing protein [Obelidium mucronatum]
MSENTMPPDLLISEAAAGGTALANRLDPVASTATDAKKGPAVSLSGREFTSVLLGLAMAVLMASLDATILATALKAVVGDFGRQDLIPWVGSSYLLTSAPFGIMYGKLADLFGRKYVFVFTMVVFEIGSLICGVAGNMSVLILGRAIAGIGGGGIFTIAFIIIADIAEYKDRAKYQGIVGGVYGLATIIGPLVGGYFSDHVTWRWCFYINLPIGAIAVPAVIWSLRLPTPTGSFTEKCKRIDIIGVLLTFCIIAALITPTQFGGSVWAWSSPQVILLYVLTAILLSLFAYVESRVAKEPIVPPGLFSNTSITAILISGLAIGAAFIGAIYYISLFFQIVNRDSATVGGVKAVPLVFGHIVLCIVTGVIMSANGSYRYTYFMAPIFMITGISLISTLDGTSYLVQQIFYLFIFGVGTGLVTQTCIAAAQISCSEEYLAIATGLAQTAVPLGGAVGIAITGALFNNLIANDIVNYPTLMNALSQLHDKGIDIQATDVLALSQLLTSVTFLSNGAEANADLIRVFNGAFKVSYLSLLAYPVIIFVMAFLIKEYRIEEGKEVALAV